MELWLCASWTARAKEAYASFVEVDFLWCVVLVFLYCIVLMVLDIFVLYMYVVFSDRMKDYEFGLVVFFTSFGAFVASAAFGWAFGDVSVFGSFVGENDVGMLMKICVFFVLLFMWMMFVFGVVVDVALGFCRFFIVWRLFVIGVVVVLFIVNVFVIFGLCVGYMLIVILGVIMVL